MFSTATGSASLTREPWERGFSSRCPCAGDSVSRPPGAARARKRPSTSTRRIEVTTTRPSTSGHGATSNLRPTPGASRHGVDGDRLTPLARDHPGAVHHPERRSASRAGSAR